MAKSFKDKELQKLTANLTDAQTAKKDFTSTLLALDLEAYEFHDLETKFKAYDKLEPEVKNSKESKLAHKTVEENRQIKIDCQNASSDQKNNERSQRITEIAERRGKIANRRQEIAERGHAINSDTIKISIGTVLFAFTKGIRWGMLAVQKYFSLWSENKKLSKEHQTLWAENEALEKENDTLSQELSDRAQLQDIIFVKLPLTLAYETPKYMSHYDHNIAVAEHKLALYKESTASKLTTIDKRDPLLSSASASERHLPSATSNGLTTGIVGNLITTEKSSKAKLNP